MSKESAEKVPTEALVALLGQRGVGHRTAVNLALTALAHGSSPDELGLGLGISDWSSAMERASSAIETDHALGIHTIGLFDPRYPPSLRAIADPPAVIWAMGDLAVLQDTRALAVVGTREPTEFGVRAARLIAGQAAANRWCVVSGLAKGVDTIAHQSALDAGGTTIAVLAGGLDSVYPASNRRLARTISSGRGALISETPTGVRPRPATFVARDRIQAALSHAVVICQTGISGGSLHTARFAAAQGVPVYCPSPNSPSSDKSEGLRVLLEQPARSLCDRFAEWETSRALCRRLGDQPLALPIPGAGGVKDFIIDLDRMVETAPVVVDESTAQHTVEPWLQFLRPREGAGLRNLTLVDAATGQDRLFR